MSPADCLFCGHCNPPASKYCNACGDALHLQPCDACGAVDGRTATHCYQCAKPFAARSTKQLAGDARGRSDALAPVATPGGETESPKGADFWRNPRSRPKDAVVVTDGPIAALWMSGTTATSPVDLVAAPDPASDGQRAPRRRLPLLVIGLIGLAGIGAYALHRQTAAKSPVQLRPPAASSTPAASPTPATPAAPSVAAAPAVAIPPNAPTLSNSPPASAEQVSAPDMPSPPVGPVKPGRDPRSEAALFRASSSRPSMPPVSRKRTRAADPAPSSPRRTPTGAQRRAESESGSLPAETAVRGMDAPASQDSSPAGTPQSPAEANHPAPWTPPRLYQG